MGLDTTHNCWHGAYSAFRRWRKKLCEVAGYGDMEKFEGFGGTNPWPENDDPLILLLDHSDCDERLEWKDCSAIASALELLLPALECASDGGGHIGLYADKTRVFIAGLRDADRKGEDVEFL